MSQPTALAQRSAVARHARYAPKVGFFASRGSPISSAAFIQDRLNLLD